LPYRFVVVGVSKKDGLASELVAEILILIIRLEFEEGLRSERREQ